VRRVLSRFAPSHRGGSGPPLVCLHGFMDTWRSWELVLPMLEQKHDVLALTLPGHAGGPPLGADATVDGLVDGVERMLDAENLELPHLVGNSLGGYVALRLAARGRAAGVVALAPAGGWAPGDRTYTTLLETQRELHQYAKEAAPRTEASLATSQARRVATRLITTNFEHIPAELLAHQMAGIAGCHGAEPLVQAALDDAWELDAASVGCPVRMVWGTADMLLPWPEAAVHYRAVLPQADWVLLDGIGHCPQLDVPVEASQLILGFTA